MKIDVTHVAKLANLPLTEEEKKKFEKQLTDVLTYVQRLKKVNTDNIPETNQSTGLENITRDDVSHPSLTDEEALSNAPKKHKNMFVVPGILEEK